MSNDKNVLKVKIYGAEYTIRGHADANYIKAIAEYVDGKMREVDANIRVDSSLKVAILSSVNIAHELFLQKKENEILRKRIEDKSNAIRQTIDLKLKESLK